ncbi:MAG: M20 family metallopeptidase [Anaerotruncus sp.]|jgi:succinyl-diaminopimelate desuccinylase|nr:M20 family metallopeptidase [Anaerotruncus sp.]
MKQYPWEEAQFINDLKGLLKIRSVNGDCGPVSERAPLGQGIYDAIEYMLDLGRKFGFRTKNLDGYAGWIEMGEGERLVAVVAHLDTVSVDPEGWVADPFDGTVIDGKLYGRGVSDDKGPAMVALYAMKAIAASGVNLGKRVRLILGGSEEAGGWRCIERYKKTEELPDCAFTPDSEYPVTFAEKGLLHLDFHRDLDDSIPPLSLHCGQMYNIVPAFAEAEFAGKHYEAEGRAAHAMEPHKGENALLKLCAQLRAQGIEHPFLSLAGIATAEGLGIAFSDEPSGCTTINPAIAHVDEKHASLCCDLRIPVTVPLEQVVGAAEKAAAQFGFETRNTSYMPPLYVKKDSPLVQTLQRVFQECTGTDLPPVSCGGGTYARAFENAVAFGALFPEDPVTYHQTNEFWKLDSIGKTFQIITNAIELI